MQVEKEQIIPGVKKLMEVEAQLKAQMQVQPADEVSQKVKWVRPTHKQLRKHKEGMHRVYLGQK